MPIQNGADTLDLSDRLINKKKTNMTPWVRKYKLSNKEVAQILEDFLNGKGRILRREYMKLG